MCSSVVKRRRLWLLVTIWLLVGCRRVDPVVKIGLVGPFEGRYRAIGYDVIYSARLAVREINQAGGIGGYRVALVALDDGGEPDLAAEAAASLVIDPAVIVVMGHWLPETTAVGRAVYAEAGLPFLAMGVPPFGEVTPTALPADFHAAYEAVTPFDEVAGVYAGTTYDAFQLMGAAMAQAAAAGQPLDRTAVAQALTDLTYEGLTGTVYQP